MPRFVLLEHDHPSLHWDLLLEAGEHLRAWRLSAPPEVGKAVSATANFPHRRLYLDYEGRVSKGRGMVKRWDSGTFDWIERKDAFVLVSLSGHVTRGQATLECNGGKVWTFVLSTESPIS